MIRHNYNPSLFERVFGSSVQAPLPQDWQRAAASVAAMCFVLTSIWGFEQHRSRQVDDELKRLDQQLVVTQADNERASALATSVSRSIEILARIRDAQRENARGTNLIAEIGNRLPGSTWLTGLQPTINGGWTITGRSTQIVEVGRTLVGLQRLASAGDVHLISIAANDHGRILDFTASLQAP